MERDRTEREIDDKTFLTLQGAIAMIVTVSLGFQGWMLLSIHDVQVQEAKVSQQLVANKEMEVQFIAFNQRQREKVEDLEVRVRVLETSTRRASIQRLDHPDESFLVNASPSTGACYLRDSIEDAVIRRRRFM
jgi:hypothetical protein